MTDTETAGAAPNPALLSPFAVRGVSARNRVVISPMCMYSAENGLANDFHFAHLGQYAIGGAGIVFTEATAITAQGRISGVDLGLYEDAQIAPLKRITTFLQSQGALAGVQLGHAGRRASSRNGWFTNDPLDATDAANGMPPWELIAPSAIAEDRWPTPRAMSATDIVATIDAWAAATRRAVAAGFDIVEVHAAHGYLIHEFLSPITNKRDDGYGGDLNNRMRFGLEVAEAVRGALPDDKPLFFRVSAIDGPSWPIENTVIFAKALKQRGVDVIDCSSGGIEGLAAGRLVRNFGFQVPFAEQVRREANIATMTVGLIVDPVEADRIVASGRADLIAIARQALEDPHWATHAEHALRESYSLYPNQYRGWLERRAVSLKQLAQQ